MYTYRFSRTNYLRWKLGLSLFCFATALIVHDRIKSYENHEDEKSFGFLIFGSIISSILLIMGLLHEKLCQCIEDGCDFCLAFWGFLKKYGVKLIGIFIFLSLECPSVYYLGQSAHFALHFPKTWYMVWLILMLWQIAASFFIILGLEENPNGNYISIESV